MGSHVTVQVTTLADPLCGIPHETGAADRCGWVFCEHGDVRSRHTALGALALVLLVLIVGCTSSSGGGDAPATPAAGPPALVALGDSISVGFAACGEAKPCPEASWVTGSNIEVKSFEERLAGAWEVDEVKATNIARPGAKGRDMPGQAEKVPEGTKGLVTLLVGANDICTSSVAGMTEPADFRAAIDATLQTVSERAPDAVVLVASVPDIPGIFLHVQNEPRAQEAWRRGHICPALLAVPAEARGATTQQIEQRIGELNTQLQEACGASDTCVWDDGTVNSWLPDIVDLSDVDVFHPSLAGQASLADELWTTAARTKPTEALLTP